MTVEYSHPHSRRADKHHVRQHPSGQKDCQVENLRTRSKTKSYNPHQIRGEHNTQTGNGYQNNNKQGKKVVSKLPGPCFSFLFKDIRVNRNER